MNATGTITMSMRELDRRKVIALSAHAQRTREYRWHLFLSMIIGSASLMLLPTAAHHFALVMVILCIASGAIFSTVLIFWSLASESFHGTAAAGGIALISSIGLIGAFLSPIVTGWIKTVTGSLATSLYAHAGMLLLTRLCLAPKTCKQ
jgi:cyanate permease